MITSKQYKLKAITLTLLAFFSLSIKAEVSIIANPEVDEDSLSFEDVKSIFTNKLLKWEDGKKINIIIIEDHYSKDFFLKNYVHKTKSQFRTYWLKQVFTGKAIMFKTVDTQEELLNEVSITPGAISFIDTQSSDERVKVIEVDR